MPKKILLADDSITIQKVVELTFSDGDYDVTAVNNGAKAVQKLSEMRPDIIMPEKNGYEVCEFVKSRPEYRHIPVVLLTGTFEPFDPDRADKAGCDAVVTKPFESQSLIHKVEELIQQSRASAFAATPAAPAAEAPRVPDAEPPSPWDEDAASASASDFRRPEDIFSDAPPAGSTTEMPFSPPEERIAQPDTSATTQQFTPPPPPADSPWDEPAIAGETRALPKMTFEEMQRLASERFESESAPAAEPPPASDDSPFGAPPPAEEFSGETRAFPRMSFEELEKMAGQTAPPPATPPADEAPSGETRAFPQMSFEQLSQAAAEMPAEPETAWSEPAQAQPEPSVWGQETAPAEPSVWDEPADAQAPAWSAASEPPPLEDTAPEEPTSEPSAAAFQATAEPAAPEPQPSVWASEPAAAEAPRTESGNGLDLTDEQIDRIARRVVQLMSEQVVRNIAWEVIPDMAEMVVKERIRQLESEG